MSVAANGKPATWAKSTITYDEALGLCSPLVGQNHAVVVRSPDGRSGVALRKDGPPAKVVDGAQIGVWWT